MTCCCYVIVFIAKMDDLPKAACDEPEKVATTNGTGVVGLQQQPSTEVSPAELELLAKLEEQNR